ncbi:hypothetical protein EW146_g1599 [Bondarzewia mesenterica]|uniref:EF-hand domain-containing protein n=1 Tax=Bondarzewia mesenterica TaxID=1095465 RepID=A0A4S4M9J2_9AGAM|nr:hypothetical protein EW146_g1599 [Bondarzewia mesenterica]
MASSDTEDDTTFLNLSARLRSQIDRAFDKVASTTTTDDNDVASMDAAGGFIPDSGFLLDDDDDDAGGFLPPSGHASTSTLKPSQMPLSRIPSALQLLDLPPADPEILSVFRNAASGWRSARGERVGRGGEEDEGEGGGLVSRKDWRSVCAVLLEGQDDDEQPLSADQVQDDDEAEEQEEEMESSGSSSSEYIDTPTKKRKPERTRSTRTRRPSSPSEPGSPKGLTLRQKREALLAFALFFPDVDPGDTPMLSAKRLGVRELANAARALREKISAEQMVEMLEAFSTSPDKTISLADFERMMVATRMA